jgi:O-antigen/teichoic acid export membrane protein
VTPTDCAPDRPMTGADVDPILSSGPPFMHDKIAKNIAWNMFGSLAPMAAAVIAIPILITRIGTEQFGALTIAWVLIGYFSVFDLGMGRGLTNALARELSNRNHRVIPALVSTAWAALLVLGMCGSVVLWFASDFLIGLLKVSPATRAECHSAFLVIICVVPVITLSAGFRGVLEALSQFRPLNIIRSFGGVFSFIGPLGVLWHSTRLTSVLLVLAASQIITCCCLGVYCFRRLPQLQASMRFDRKVLSPLLRYGGWLTVTNIVAPFMASMDRLLMAAFVSVQQLPYYAVPFDAVSKILVLPIAFNGVLFPVFSAHGMKAGGTVRELYENSVKATALLVFPPLLITSVFARPILALWLGNAFADRSWVVLQILCAGLLINSLALVPYTVIQALGRPDITAKAHMVELPVYAALLILTLPTFGVVGAAVCWTVRVTLDAAFLFYMAHTLLMPSRETYWRPGSRILIIAAVTAITFAFPFSRPVLVGAALVAVFFIVPDLLELAAMTPWLRQPPRRSSNKRLPRTRFIPRDSRSPEPNSAAAIIDKHDRLANLTVQPTPVMLELGCGPEKRFAESIGIDAIDYDCVDVVGDVYDVLNEIPSGSVHYVHTSHLLEHLHDLTLIVNELSRVVATNGTIEIIVPHFSNPYFYSDPTHRNFFGLYTFSYFAEDNILSRRVPAYVRNGSLELMKVRFVFRSDRQLDPMYLVRRLVGLIVNSTTYAKEFYEEFLPFLFPCYEIVYVLRRL